MTLAPLEWSLVLLPLLLVGMIAAYTHRYVQSVADFMAAGRCARRYLLATARGEVGGAVPVAIAIFEITSTSGFTLNWWNTLGAPVGLLVAITGFVIYRYRQTRALTVAQFFQIRYSRRFRLFMGALAFFAGILNYGVFPAIGGRFFVYFLGLPETLDVFSIHVPTWFLFAAGYLSCTLFFVLTGGQISLLISDCLEGILSQLGYVIITVALFVMFSWAQISSVLARAPTGHSLLNPFDTRAATDFNLWFVLIQIFSGIYGTMAWQNQHAFNSSALTPHESRMAGILGNWRGFARSLMLTMLAICAMTFLQHADFATRSASVAGVLGGIENPQVQTQMQVPVALRFMLPVGIKGLFCAIMLLGLISGDSAHLHSWGSIFAQDVVLPLLKKPLSPRQHLRLLRGSMTGVAVFALFFSLLFRQSQYVQMWWIITTAVFLGGTGAVIIGGLYWKKGTTAGAWCAMIVGSTLALAGIVVHQVNPHFPLNSAYMNLIVILTAITVYVTVSWLTCREDFDMDRLLHRGRYALADTPAPVVETAGRRFRLSRALGIDAEFNFWDRFVTYGIFAWAMTWFGVFVIGSIWNLLSPWPLRWWSSYWYVTGILLPFVISVITTVWFTIGGLSDMRLFFRRLRVEKRDAHDDGIVIERHNPDATEASREGLNS